MTTMTIVQARANLADAVNRVSYGGERIALGRRGKPVAALVSMEDLAALERMEDKTDLREARRVLSAYKRKPESFTTLAGYKRTLAGK